MIEEKVGSNLRRCLGEMFPVRDLEVCLRVEGAEHLVEVLMVRLQVPRPREPGKAHSGGGWK